MPPSPTATPPLLTRWAAHQDFSRGIISDTPSALIPEGGVWGADNMLADKPGTLRRRGPTIAPGSTGTPTLVQVGSLITGTLDGLTASYGLPATAASVGLKINSINLGSGVFTPMVNTLPATSSPILSGRPFKHFANLVFPQINLGGSTMAGVVCAGGATTTKANTTGTAGTITAGSDSITGLAGINPTTQMELGGYVYATDGGSPKNVYLGRVIELTSSTACRVEPAPVIGFTATAVLFSTTWTPSTNYAGTGAKRAGMVGCSFQNRILLANVHDWGAGSPAVRPRRVIYSILPAETSSMDTVMGQTTQGYKQLLLSAFEDNNFFEIPGADPIIALVPVNEGNLLIFTRREVYRFTGFLETETANTAGGVTYDIQRLSSTVGCVSEQSIQQTPHGVVFASNDGVYLYDGGTTVKPLMTNRTQNDWRGAVSVFSVAGSALLRPNIYMVSFATSFGYIVNLDTGAWTRISGASAAIWDAFYDPSSPTSTNVYGIRWYNTASPPSHTNGQLVRLDTILAPGAVSPDTDGDGASVTGTFSTKYYGETDAETLKNFKRIIVEYAALASSPTAITLQRSSLGPEVEPNPWPTIGTLPTAVDMRRQTGGFWSVVRSAGVAYRFIGIVPFEVYGVKHSFAPTQGRSS